jgi:hypothetical protein
MSGGIPILRDFVIVLSDGSPVYDWGEGVGVDLFTGEFVLFNSDDYSHPIQDEELDVLRKAGRINSYDQQKVFVPSLPERTTNSIT